MQFAIELVLVGVAGGFSRYLVEESHQARQGLAARVEHLSEVNELLLDLHRATEREVTPMHVEGAARWALERLDEMFTPDVAAVVLLDPTTRTWHVAAGNGVRTGTPENPVELPRAVVRRRARDRPGRPRGPAPGPALPVALGPVLPHARPRRDRGRPRRRGQRTKAPRGIDRAAPDRATWPGPRRWPSTTPGGSSGSTPWAWSRSGPAWRASSTTTSASRWCTWASRSTGWWSSTTGAPCRPICWSCAATCATSSRSCATCSSTCAATSPRPRTSEGVLRSFLERVNKRNRVEVTLVADTDSRMPLPVEREVWRVAREAVMNAERHARASHVSILWLCNDEGALLEVADDGVGLPAGKTSGESGYGLVGMRERADSIGAQLEITSGPGQGHVGPNENEGGVMVRVLIADDHTMVREGLRWALEHAGLDVVGEAADGEEAVDMAEQHHPDVVLMDLSLPVLSGAAATKRIRTPRCPNTSVLVLSMLSDDTAVSSALDAGAGGYLVKDCTTSEIVDAVNRVAAGRARHRPLGGRGRRGTVGAQRQPALEAAAQLHPPAHLQARGGGAAAHGHRGVDPRGGTAALHQRQDREEPPVVDLPEARLPRPGPGGVEGHAHGPHPDGLSHPTARGRGRPCDPRFGCTE